MKIGEGNIGRVFVLRLENGDRLPDCVEAVAREKGISMGHVILVGGIGSGQVVVGPKQSDAMPPEPMLLPIDGAHEVVGIGVIAPGPDGKAQLHMHAALGRSGSTMTGCIRPGVDTWIVGEAIIYEIKGVKMARRHDMETGFALLVPD